MLIFDQVWQDISQRVIRDWNFELMNSWQYLFVVGRGCGHLIRPPFDFVRRSISLGNANLKVHAGI
jgi:hypothetical protein